MKAHRTDGLSLTFGLVFLAIVAWWLVARTVDLSLPHLGWFVAGALIVLGVLGLLGALRTAPAPVEPPASAPPDVTTPEPAPDLAQDLPEDRTETDLFDSRSEGETGRP